MASSWIIGNWKMNGRLNSCEEFINKIKTFRLPEKICAGIALPFPYIKTAGDLLKNSNFLCGAEDCSRFADNGAYTGEVSAAMIADCGANFVLIGHSERRTLCAENNEILSIKMKNAIDASLTPILCVGETLQQREQGEELTVINEQLGILKNTTINEITVAYEPVWAIGTGKSANSEQIAQMHAYIHRQILSITGRNVIIRVLYGGSVQANNAESILHTANVDGALIGGASLQAESFIDIINAAHNC